MLFNATNNGRRLAFPQLSRLCCVKSIPHGNSMKKKVMPMLTIETLIAVLSFGLTAFGLGYAIGQNSKKH